MTVQKVVAVLLGFVFTTVPAFAQADRGVITGLVTDQQGAAVPNARVQITNEDTRVPTSTISSSSGNYTSPALIIGVYSVKVEVPGFKTFAATNIRLDSGQTYRQDAHLEVGEVTQTLAVTASAVALNETNAEVSASVDQKYYQDLPAVVSTEMRIPENMLYTIPGFVSLKPTNTFPAGTQFHSRLNGGQRTAFENYLDGASYGEVSGHNQTQERSAPFESIAEMRVIENTFSAQYGHTSGGFVEYTTKSGTSAYHGSVYEYAQNSALNARGEVGAPIALHQNSFGFTLGGPIIIPKVYRGRQKTFFFFTLDQMRMSQGQSTSLITVPTASMRQGNFTELLGRALGTDACGRQVFSGQIYDPATTRDASTCGGPRGVSVRDPFPGNVAPIRSQIGSNINNLYLNPTNPGISNNYIQAARDHYLRPRTYLGRIDHNATDNLRLTNTINFNDRPRQTDCGGVGGCFRTTAIETGDIQDIATITDHFQVTWIAKPNLFTHFVLGYDRWVIPSVGDYQNQGWASKIGLQGLLNGDQGGFPGINFDARGYAPLGRPAGTSNQATDRYQFLNDTTWNTGKHTVKVGIEFRRERWASLNQGNVASVNNFSFKNTAAFDVNGLPIAGTGDPYASMLLGQVSSATFDILANPDFRRNYWAPWINDDFKIAKRLTLSFGYRMDLQGPRTETRDRYSRFNPGIANPLAGGRLGGLEFAGVNGAPHQFETLVADTYGPRQSFAYEPKNTWVVRGGYGIYYAPVVMNQNGTPIAGFSSSPLATDLTNGQQPAFFWDSGFPQTAVRIPPFIDPSFANGQSVIWAKADTLKLPRYQNWTFSIQKQLRDDLVLETAYTGVRGTRLISGQFLSGANQNDPAILTQYPLSLLTSSITSPQAISAGIPLPYAGFTGTVAQALRPFPQYQTITAQNGANGESMYHALQVRLEKRFSSGLQFRFSYIFSKLMNNGAESGQSESDTPPQTVFQHVKALSVDDVPHQVILAYTYQLPFGKGKRFLRTSGFTDYLLGGWNISGIQRYSTGRPLGISMSNLYSSVLFDTALYPNRVAGVSGYLNHDNAHFDITKDRYFTTAGWTAPPAGQLGNASRVDPVVRGWAAYNEDLSLFKNFAIKEPLTLRMGGNFSNIFNRHEWCDPNTNFSDPAFGSVNGQCNVPRRIEVYAKFTF